MWRTLWFVRTITLLTLLVASSLAIAGQQSKFDPQARAAAIAPFLREATLAVLHVDLSRVQAESLLDAYQDIAPGVLSKQAGSQIPSLVERLLKAGARDVFLLFDLRSIPTPGPSFIVPLPVDANDEEIGETLAYVFPAVVVARLEGALFAGDQGMLDRLRNAPREPRPELAAAFEAAGDTVAQFVVLPTEDARRVGEEALMKVPQVGDVSSAVRRVRWIAIGLNAPRPMSMRLLLETADAQAAEEWTRIVAEAVRFAGQTPLVQRTNKFDPLAKRLVPVKNGPRVVVALDEHNGGAAALRAFLQAAAQEAETEAQSEKSMLRIKQIGLALHNYHDTYARLPSPAILDSDGKPLLSWRVAILPFLEQANLFKEFRRDEPWDSEHNKKLIARMPDVYRLPGSKVADADRTNFVIPRGLQTAFPGARGLNFRHFRDGLAKTILVVTVDDDNAVPWTKPEDWEFDPDHPAAALGGAEKGFLLLFADGHASVIAKNIDQAALRGLFSPDGREAVDPSLLEAK